MGSLDLKEWRSLGIGALGLREARELKGSERNKAEVWTPGSKWERGTQFLSLPEGEVGIRPPKSEREN